MSIHSLPLSPYFHYTELKIVLEVLYVLMLLQLIAAEVVDIKERTDVKRQESIENNSGNDAYFVCLLSATKDHYTGKEKVGNFLDLFNIICGFALCYMWYESVMSLDKVTHMLSDLHRPLGDITYDDDDSDRWLAYHEEVAHLDELINETIENLVTFFFFSSFNVFVYVTKCLKEYEETCLYIVYFIYLAS